MNDIALTPEYLEHLLALGKAVPAGPWGTCLNATELFGRYFPDWGTIYANVERCGGVFAGCIIATTNRNFISDEERAAAWEKDKTGEKVDPGLSGKIAAYIAAYHPGVTTALIMEILRLRAEAERLNKEADWMAQQFQNCPDEVEPDGEYWDICKMEDCAGVGKEDVAACWRRAASKRAVEKEV